MAFLRVKLCPEYITFLYNGMKVGPVRSGGQHIPLIFTLYKITVHKIKPGLFWQIGCCRIFSAI